jgi:hypothetical protein
MTFFINSSRNDDGYIAVQNADATSKFRFFSDLLSVYTWILLHLALTATDIHHDAAGLITAIICLFGKKFWTVFLPVNPNESQEVLERAMAQFISDELATVKQGGIKYEQCFKTLRRTFRPVCFILEPGDVL